MPERIDMTDHAFLVGGVVAQVRRRYRGVVEVEDLQQEAAVWWYGEGQKYLAEYLAEDKTAALRTALRRYLGKYAEREKAHKEGYEPGDQVRYRSKEIVALLPVAFEPGGLPSPGTQDGPKPKGNLAEGGDVLAALLDVRAALATLGGDDLYLLRWADRLGHDWERLAVLTETQADSVRRRHARIVERMARWLNNEEELVAA